MKMAADYGNLLTSPASQTCWFPADVFCFSCLNAKYWSSLISFYRKLFLNFCYFNDLFLQIHLPFHLYRVILLFRIFSYCIWADDIGAFLLHNICVVYMHIISIYFYQIIIFLFHPPRISKIFTFLFFHYHRSTILCYTVNLNKFKK